MAQSSLVIDACISPSVGLGRDPLFGPEDPPSLGRDVVLSPPGCLFGRALDLGLASRQIDQVFEPAETFGAARRIHDLVHREQAASSGSQRCREGSRELARHVGEGKVQEEPAILMHPSAAP